MLRVHDGKTVNVGEPVLANAPLGLAQHRDRQVDASDPTGPGILGQRQSGADANFEDTAAYAFGSGNRRPAAALKHGAEHEIVDRCPACVSLGDSSLVEFGPYRRATHTLCTRVPWRRHQRTAAIATPAPVVAVFQAATVLAINPPPSTRA